MPKPKKKIFLIIFLVLFLGLGVFFLINKTAIIDRFKAIGYNPTPAMLSIKDSLNLTDDGERIFNATHPILASRDDFNESCNSDEDDEDGDSDDTSIYVFGCYAHDRIYVYNIDDDELAGVRESISAHELLHAVWVRLPGLEKSNLVPILEETYDNIPEMKAEIDTYPEDEQIGEIYVRLATQVKQLPEALETHYAKYLKDQDSIVGYFESYVTPFKELTEKNHQLKAELETLEKEINERTSALDTRIEAFEKAVKEFNNCTETAGCFSDDWSFQSRRAELVNEQLVLDTENNLINDLITTYNKKAEEFNKNIVHRIELWNTMDPKAPVKTIEE